MPLNIHGDFIIQPIFNDINLYPESCLGIPRDNNSDFGAYEALANWLENEGVKSICGQVLSGAQMAFAVSMASNNNICSVYIPKEGYSPKKHSASKEIPTPYVIIDDIVSSGEAIYETIEVTTKLSRGFEPLYIIVDRMFKLPEILNHLNKNIFYSVYRRPCEI